MVIRTAGTFHCERQSPPGTDWVRVTLEPLDELGKAISFVQLYLKPNQLWRVWNEDTKSTAATIQL